MLRKLAINTGSNFAFQFFSMALSFVSVPIFLSAVGAEGYGILLLVASLLNYFEVLNAGVPASTVKYVAEYNAKDDSRTVNEVINSSFVFYIAAGIIVAIAVTGFAAAGGMSVFKISAPNQKVAENILYAAAVLTIIGWPINTLGQALAGLEHYPERNLANGLGSLVSKSLAIGAALADQSLMIIFLCQNSNVVVTAGLNTYYLRKVFPAWSMRIRYFRMATLRMIFSYSVWMLLEKLRYILIDKTDRIILGIFLPVSSLTIYHIVSTPAKYIETFSHLFSSTITPAVSAAEARHGRRGLDGFIYIATRYANAFVAPMAIIGALLCGPLIGLWVGPEYLPFVWIAQIACLMKATHVLAGLYQVFNGAGIVKEKALIGIFAAIVNIPLGIWWVQVFGVAGVIFASIAARLIDVPLMIAFAFPKLKIDVRRYVREAIVRGQWSSWLLGLLLIPAWPYFQEIDSWYSFSLFVVLLGLLFYSVSVWTVVEVRHRQRAQSGLTAVLARRLPNKV